MWKIVKEHWDTIPSKKSHYCYNKTERKYFDHPDLNVKILHIMFKQYYKEKTGKDSLLKYNTYHKFFRKCSNYSFRSPKTDVCDFCTQCEVKLKANPNDLCKVPYENHLKKVEEYKNFKRKYVPESKKGGNTSTFDRQIYNDTLVLEFDYAQNLPLPKLNINSHYYKRILNLYVFNIHCFNDSESKMCSFLECDGKKDSNSVCSFLDNFISRKLSSNPSFKKIVLFSDAAGGQNKNLTVVKFCSYLAKKYSIEIMHVFPVRGHSYCQCDRNFGVYGAVLKKKPVIESPDEYLNIMRSARNNPKPFEAEMCNDLLKDWATALNLLYAKTPKLSKHKFSIQKYVKIKYNKVGEIFTYSEYNEDYQCYSNPSKISATFDLLPIKKPGISDDKKKDLQFFLPFLEPQNQNWLLSVLNTVDDPGTNNVVSDEEQPEEDDS